MNGICSLATCLAVLLAAPFAQPSLRIEPDWLGIVHYDGTTIQELASAQVASTVGAWYSVKLLHVAGGPGGGTLSVLRISDAPGAPVAMVLSAPLDDAPLAGAIGFTVGAAGAYQFQLVEYADGPDVAEMYIDWDYDAYGRKVAETVYDNTNTVTAETL
jgi:hypothetical protein